MKMAQGDRVLAGAEAKPGAVNYVRFAPPDFRELAAVSVILDERQGDAGYEGTIFDAAQVRPLLQ